jgi:tRNA pseudouridine55 synthase
MTYAPRPAHGLLVLDKPPGITSRDAVDRALHWFPRGTRVGHTGTLDPLATGVLVLCLGSATRLTEYVQRMRKTYQATFLLGARSDTDDADGEVHQVEGVQPPTLDTLIAALDTFVGVQEQVPPAFSAAKISGRRAYELARGGKEVSLAARKVAIYDIRLLGYAYPRVEVEVRCGKGTYIRSLARDLGERVGCGALVESLRRIRVGPFDLTEAVDLDTSPDVARTRLLPVSAALTGLPRVELEAAQMARLRHGQAVPVADSLATSATPEGAEIAVFDPAGALVAVGLLRRAQGLIVPLKVFGAEAAEG